MQKTVHVPATVAVESAAPTAAPLPAYWTVLGARLNESFIALGESDPSAYLDMLDGQAPAVKSQQLTTLAAANNALAPSARASDGDLLSMIDALLSESKSRLAASTDVYSDEMAAKRQQRRVLAAGSNEAVSLDVDLRQSCMIITRTARRRCGICGNDDLSGSGCGYGGFSPQPRTEITLVGWDAQS